jgi:hypothetical protein
MNQELILALLTIIEDNIHYRKVFGFKGGDVLTITTGGKSLIQICHDIATTLFLESMIPVHGTKSESESEKASFSASKIRLMKRPSMRASTSYW